MWFVYWQFDNRNRASAFLNACNETAAHWLERGVSPDDLVEESLPEMSNLVVPRYVASTFRRVYRPEASRAQRVTLGLMALWTVAAGIYVMLRYFVAQ